MPVVILIWYHLVLLLGRLKSIRERLIAILWNTYKYQYLLIIEYH